MSFWNWQNIPPPGTNIDMSHPMARDLAFFFNGHEAQHTARDLVTGRVAEYLKERTAGRGKFRTAFGYHSDYPTNEATNANGYQWPAVPGDTSGRRGSTVEGGAACARVHPGTLATTSAGRVVTKPDVANNTDNWSIQRTASVQNSFEFRFRDDSGTGVTVALTRPSGDFDNIGPLDLASRCDTTNTTGFDAYYYLPGIGEYVESTGNTSPTTLGDSINGIAVGCGGTGRARVFDGYIDYAAYFAVPKSLKFLQRFQENPWQIFEQPRALPDAGPISYVFGTNTDTTGTSITGIEPSGTQQGDLVLALVQSAETPSTGTWTPPTDFVEIDSFAETTGNKDSHWWLGYKIRGATAGDGYQFDFSGTSDSLSIIISTFRGVSQGTPLDVTWSRASHYAAYDSGTNDVNTAAQDIVVASDTAWVVLLQAVSRSISGEAAPPYGYKERNDGLTGQALNKGLYICTKLRWSGTENPGPFQHTDVTGDADSKTFTIALRPSGVGPEITDVANSGETPGSGTETFDAQSTGNVITGTGFL